MGKRIIVLAVVVASIVCLGLLMSSSSKDSLSNSQTKPGLSQLSYDGQLIDVREPSEYFEGHADGAINIPLSDILSGDFSRIDNDRSVYVYCRSGVRAEKAKNALEEAGFKEIINIGGLNDWLSNGGKTCSSAKPSC